MRAALVVLAMGLACAAAQVSYAPSPGAGGRPGGPGAPRRRRIRVGRKPRPDPQPAPEAPPVSVLPVEVPSRQQFASQPQLDLQQASPSFQQPEYQSQAFEQAVSPAPTYRPSVRPAASIQAGSRTGSRFRPQQIEYDDYELEEEREDEDYEDEPDRLSILLQESAFQCQPSDSGYFADDSVDCEVFHYCSEGIKHSWICPEGNAFHQINLICMPQGSDNICKRSSDFHFVNDYLYQQINNDSLRPQYADRYYPDASLSGDNLQSRPAPQATYTDRQERPVRRRLQQPRPQPQPDFGVSGNGFGNDGFRQPQSGSVIRPQQQQRQQVGFSESVFRQRQASAAPPPQQRELAPLAASDASFQRRDDSRPLPAVRDLYPQRALSPSINFRGAPRPAQERRDDIVLGGFQGNVDIEELASRAGQ